jgi:hypothetical protein
MIVEEFAITSIAHPTQIEGKLTDGRQFYIRYRNNSFYAEVDGKCITRQYIQSTDNDIRFDDYMSTPLMFKYAGFQFFVEEE